MTRIVTRCSCGKFPLGYTDELGERIVNCASSHMDEKYDDWLIAADLMRNSLLGHYLDHQLHGAVTEFLTAWADQSQGGNLLETRGARDAPTGVHRQGLCLVATRSGDARQCL